MKACLRAWVKLPAFLFVLALSVSVQVGPVLAGDLLWKIEKQDAPPSWLLGTIHSGDERILDIPKPVLKALHSSRLFVWELKDHDVDAAALRKALELPRGEQLSDWVDNHDLERAMKAGLERGYPPKMVNRMKPATLAMLFSFPPGASAEYLDKALHDRARKSGKPVAGLETMAEQLSVFDGLSREESAEYLRDTLNLLPRQKEFMEKLLQAYLSRNLSALERIVEEADPNGSSELDKKLMYLLIDERNRRMVRRMQPALKGGGVFVAVGALHLPGEQGLVSLLKKQGYSLTPVH